MMTTSDMPDDLTQMVCAHGREVYALLVAITRQPAVAGDLAQEIFFVAHRKRVRAGNGVRFWLHEVARRPATNELCRKRPQAAAPEEMSRLADTRVKPDDGTADDTFHEQLAALRLCLEELPVPDREVLAVVWWNRTDPDADGHTTWQEWRCQTDPTNALSVLRLLSASYDGTNVTVTWQSIAGVNYVLECSTNLTTTPRFTPLATNLPGQPGTTTVTVTNAVGPGPFFYRVGVGD